MLPAQARLSESKGFKTVYNRGRSNVTDLIVVYVLPRPGGSRVRIGFVAGKKVGRAVERNRAKRLMREAARLLLSRITGSFDVVIVARHAIIEAPFSSVSAHLEKILERAGLLVAAE